MSQDLYKQYVAHMQRLADVESSISLLTWDQEVYLPKKGAERRGQQLATLSGIAHDLFTDPKLEGILNELNNARGNLDDKQSKNVALSLKDLQKIKKLSKEFVVRRSKAVSQAFHSWIKAREDGNFAHFQKPLSELVEIKREQAELLTFEEHPYDALLDEYEPGMTCRQLDELFKDVKLRLVEYVREIREQPQIDHSFLHKHYGKQKQWDYGIDLLKKIGYDFDAGRQDISTHPFTINFSSNDVRVTTRIDEQDLGNMAWSCIHEGGHALYEQGLPEEQYGLPLGRYLSLGIHESQSRLWENNVGRSLHFWKSEYKDLKEIFPDNLTNVSLEQFYKGINRIAPNLIRTESDELHYHFHVLIRYEIEKLLIEGNLKVSDLPELWNSKYKAYLDLDVPNDKLGILQDIHWAHGSFGYFPTYSLGSFYAAQLFHQAEKDIPNLVDEIESGNTQPLLKWLRENVHSYGRYYTAQQLCEKITGEPLNFDHFMRYARKKFDRIYSR